MAQISCRLKPITHCTTHDNYNICLYARKDLESTVQDPVRGVRVRRQVLAPQSKHKGALDALPYTSLDYSKVTSMHPQMLNIVPHAHQQV